MPRFDLLLFHDLMETPETRVAECSSAAAKARATRLAARLDIPVDVFVHDTARDVAENYLGTATPYGIIPGAFFRREV